MCDPIPNCHLFYFATTLRHLLFTLLKSNHLNTPALLIPSFRLSTPFTLRGWGLKRVQIEQVIVKSVDARRWEILPKEERNSRLIFKRQHAILVMSSSNSTFASTAELCGSWLLPISIGPGTLTGFDAQSFCLPPCCVPCPPQSIRQTCPQQCPSVGWSLYLRSVDAFFPQYVGFFKVLDIINLISLFFVVLYCIIWMTVLYRSPKFRVRSRYVIGTAAALVIWHTPGLITLIANPETVLCDNPISRATARTNQLCAAQGPPQQSTHIADCRISPRVLYSCCGNAYLGMTLTDRCCGVGWGSRTCICNWESRVYFTFNTTSSSIISWHGGFRQSSLPSRWQADKSVMSLPIIVGPDWRRGRRSFGFPCWYTSQLLLSSKFGHSLRSRRFPSHSRKRLS